MSAVALTSNACAKMSAAAADDVFWTTQPVLQVLVACRHYTVPGHWMLLVSDGVKKLPVMLSRRAGALVDEGAIKPFVIVQVSGMRQHVVVVEHLM